MKRRHLHVTTALVAGVLISFSATKSVERAWLAGDSHIHSHWSPGYNRNASPPEPIKGGDARYPTPMNARMARQYGLSWMVTTDHGGPNHAKFNMVHAYAELMESRKLVPDVLQFYGMELNMPGMDHHTLIVPNGQDERAILYDIESQFDANDPWPIDPSRNTEAVALRGLAYMMRLPRLPILFANHPSRSAKGLGQYGLDEPGEIRTAHDLAPDVYRGMEGGPGHQAGTLAPDGSARQDEEGRPTGFRGAYRNRGAYTLGGFDQMTAVVGGLWDSLLGEGRRFWIVATSDSHVHYTEPSRPGSDFWPGEYHKTYVRADRTYDGVVDGLRSGRVFAVAGDLISELDLVARAAKREAEMGGTLRVEQGTDVAITIRFRDPESPNVSGANPSVARVDLIVGQIRGPVQDRQSDKNDTTMVVARFTGKEWTRKGDVYTITYSLTGVERPVYLRVRGTSTSDLEPPMDAEGENPWSDLWFYSNPIFIEVVK